MLDFIEGRVVEVSPQQVVLAAHGVGYGIQVSAATAARLQCKPEAKLYTVLQFSEREMDFRLFGFLSSSERALYRLLRSVNGVGAVTAMHLLAALEPDRLVAAIFQEDVKSLEKVKGIGAKTAGRIVVELKDRIHKLGVEMRGPAGGVRSDTATDATLALQSLGYNQLAAARAVAEAMQVKGDAADVETVVRTALQLIK